MIKDNIAQLNKLTLEVGLLSSFPFGEKIVRPAFSIIPSAYTYPPKETLATIEDTIEFITKFISDVNRFYDFLFHGLPKKKFILYKSANEKQLFRKFNQLISQEGLINNNKERLNNFTEAHKAAKKLGEIVSKRFFNENPEFKNYKDPFYKYFFIVLTERIHENVTNLYANQLELIREEQEKTSILAYNEAILVIEKQSIIINDQSNKLKRNQLTDTQLRNYISIIFEFALSELNGQKINISAAINKNQCQTNYKTSLYSAFNKWKNRNKDSFQKILLISKNILYELSPKHVKENKDQIISEIIKELNSQ